MSLFHCFGIKGIPLKNLKVIRRLKDQALSFNPIVSNRAFNLLYDLYVKAKLTLDLVKTDPRNAAIILKSRQLDLTNFLGDPNKKIDYFL